MGCKIIIKENETKLTFITKGQSLIYLFIFYCCQSALIKHFVSSQSQKYPDDIQLISIC